MSSYVGVHSDGTVAYGESQVEITQSKAGLWLYVGPRIGVSDPYAPLAAWGHLRIAALIRGPVPLEIERVRWDDASWMVRRLHQDPGVEVAGSGGDYTLTLDYRDGDGGPLIARTVKAYVGGDVGPISRTNTHTLFAVSESFDDHTWTDPAPKLYAPDEQMQTGRARRRRRADTMISTLRATVVGGGGDPVALLGALLPAVEAFVESASPAPLLGALQSAAPALVPVVEAELTPWMPEEEP